MTDMLKATRVGDSWKDVCGNVSRIVALTDSRRVVSRKGRGYATYTVYGFDATGKESVLAHCVKSLDKAMSL